MQQQVLVIDREDGPADVLMHTLGVLLDQRVAVTTVTDPKEALGALKAGFYDLVVIGTPGNHTGAMASRIRAHHSNLPVVVVEEGPAPPLRWHDGISEVVNLPRRAAEIRALAGHMTRHYLA